ncbi:MAG: hypothetical protein PHP62_06150 [Candidatus Moranbacteria bacterium]|nr:hypothetical protein [Candidatus Moranbacteria bacterium]
MTEKGIGIVASGWVSNDYSIIIPSKYNRIKCPSGGKYKIDAESYNTSTQKLMRPDDYEPIYCTFHGRFLLRDDSLTYSKTKLTKWKITLLRCGACIFILLAILLLIKSYKLSSFALTKNCKSPMVP